MLLGVSKKFKGTYIQIMAALAITIGEISDGMHFGWTSPVLPILEQEDSLIKITLTDRTWLELIYMCGGLACFPITMYMVDNIGRRNSVTISAIINLISWMLIGIANKVEHIYIARFLAGSSDNITFVAAVIYVAEIADPKIRGLLSTLIYIMQLIGILVIYTIAPNTKFYVPSIIGGVILIFQLIILFFVPYSPYYLISKGKEANAKKHLQTLRSSKDINDEFTDITNAIRRQISETVHLRDLVKSKSNRKAVLIMIFLHIAQQFSSSTVMQMNVHEILSAAESVYLSPTISAIVFSVLMLIATVIALFTIDKFGRKVLLTISSLLTGLSLLALAIFFSLKNNGIEVDKISWISTASIIVYPAVFKYGLGTIPVLMPSELFPIKVKALAVTVSELFYMILSLISLGLYQILTNADHYDLLFYIFAFSCFLAALIIQVYIPETKGKTLEEIQFILKGELFSEKQ